MIDALDGVALEVSTAGLHKPVGELYPDASLLRGAKRITLASDAHRAEDVGRDFETAVEHARAAGFETVTGVRRAIVAPGAARVNDYRVGIGVDAHALVEGVPLVLGGVEIPFPRGLAGHSDGDVITHALIDAILGAAGLDDIGAMFPSGDPRWEGALVDRPAHAGVRRRAGTGLQLVNADCILIGEEPRLGPDREQMRKRIAGALVLTRSGSRCARRRRTGSASQAVVRDLPHKRSRRSAGDGARALRRPPRPPCDSLRDALARHVSRVHAEQRAGQPLLGTAYEDHPQFQLALSTATNSSPSCTWSRRRGTEATKIDRQAGRGNVRVESGREPTVLARSRSRFVPTSRVAASRAGC